jgi:hypothetical protein
MVKFSSNFGAKGFNAKIIGYYFRTFKCKFLGAKQICYDFTAQK